MNLRKLIPAFCIAGAMLGAAAPASAYPYGDHWRDRGPYHEGWGHDRGWRNSGWHDRGWNGHHRGAWNGERGWGYRGRHCWWEWHHHDRYRVCR